MKVNTPGKFFDTILIENLGGPTPIYQIKALRFKNYGGLFFTLNNNEFIMNITLKDKVSSERHLLEELTNNKIKHRFTKQGTIEWLHIPSYYFNYESK